MIDIGYTRYRDFRERHRDTHQLSPRLLHMVLIQMDIAQHMDELTRFVASDLAQDVRQEGVRGDIERDAQEQVSGPLIELAVQGVVIGIHVELTHHVARGQGHLIEVLGIPGAHQDPP